MNKQDQSTIPIFVVSAIACFHLAINIYVPALPSVAEDFGAHRDIVQMSVGAFLIGSAFASLVYGILSDQLGRKPVLIVGLSIFCVTSVICAFSPTIETLIIMRALQGMGAGCISVNCFSIIQEQYDIKECAKVLGWMGIVREIIIAFSPILGGYMVVAFGWRSTFLIVAFALALVVLYGKKKLFETSKVKRVKKVSLKPVLKDYKHILRNLQFLRYIIIFPLLICGLWCYLTVAPFYFITVLNIPTELFGYYIAPAAITYSLGSIATPKIIGKFGLNFALRLGIYSCLLAGIAHLTAHYLLPGDAFLIVGIQSIYVLGLSLVFAPSITKAVEPFHDRRATANSIGSMVRQTGAGLGGIAGGFFNDSNMLSVACFLIVLPGVALITFTALKYLSKSKA